MKNFFYVVPSGNLNSHGHNVYANFDPISDYRVNQAISGFCMYGGPVDRRETLHRYEVRDVDSLSIICQILMHFEFEITPENLDTLVRIYWSRQDD
jgi:hypothetical protein